MSRLNLRIWLVFLGLLVTKPSLAGDDPGAVGRTRLPREQLLVFRDQAGGVRPVKTVEDWQRRRAEILEGVASVMGKLPGAEKRCDLAMKVEEEVDRGSYWQRRISYASEPGSRVPAYLLVPKAVLAAGAKPMPAVLCPHPTDNVTGAGVVVGLGRSAYAAYARELAELGFVTLAPAYPLLADYQPDLKALGWESGSLKAVWDDIRGLDLLETLPYVKPGGFAAVGHSLGGHNSVFTAVLDDRIKVVVSSCGLDLFTDYYGASPAVWDFGKGWVQTRYMPRLGAYKGRLDAIPFDFAELVGTLAPRHVLIVAPARDSNFRAESVDRIVKSARPVFELQGHPERLEVTHPDAPHEFPEAERKRAYSLIGQVLGSAK